MLDKKKAINKCLAHHGSDTCRYLGINLFEGTYLCLKLHPVQKYARDMAAEYNDNAPQGDYCKGVKYKGGE